MKACLLLISQILSYSFSLSKFNFTYKSECIKICNISCCYTSSINNYLSMNKSNEEDQKDVKKEKIDNSFTDLCPSIKECEEYINNIDSRFKHDIIIIYISGIILLAIVASFIVYILTYISDNKKYTIRNSVFLGLVILSIGFILPIIIILLIKILLGKNIFTYIGANFNGFNEKYIYSTDVIENTNINKGNRKLMNSNEMSIKNDIPKKISFDNTNSKDNKNNIYNINQNPIDCQIKVSENIIENTYSKTSERKII